MSILLVTATSHYLRLTEALKTSAPFTVSMWVYPISGASDGVCFYLGSFASSKASWNMTVLSTANGNKGRFQIFAGATPLNVDSAGTVTRNSWNHVAIVEGSTTDHRVYVNGGGKGSSTTSLSPPGVGTIDRTSVGAIDTDFEQRSFFDGRVEHLGFWSVALSDAEIAALGAGKVSPLQVDPDNLQNYYPLNDVTLLRDIRGANNNFTAFNSPTTVESATVPRTIVLAT